MSLLTDSLQLDARGAPEALLLQLTSARDSGAHVGLLDALSARPELPGFALATLAVSDWNADLSPWPAPPVFADADPFEGRAGATLDALLAGPLPALRRRFPGLPVCLGGYSLAGLFALWTFCESDAFDAVNAASPSVWFPGWDAYADAHPPRGRAACLSLGRREPAVRNARMATVGDAIVRQRARFEALALPAVLEWNAGGHFTEPVPRVARGFAWTIRQMTEMRNDP